MHIAIVGAGTMGTRVALRAARGGCTVTLIGRDPARARERLAAAGVEEEHVAEAARVAVSGDLADAAAAGLVYEVIPEDLAAKRALFGQLAAVLPAATALVSGTSSFVPDRLGTPDRPVIVAHFLHPVTLVALAELIVPPAAAAAHVATVEGWLAAMAMHPVRLQRAVPGFLVNRLQFALLREALALVEAGVATAAEVDAVVELGLGPRWSATGPIQSAQLGGWSTFATIARGLLPALDARPDAPLFDGPPPRAGSDTELAVARLRRRAAVRALGGILPTVG